MSGDARTLWRDEAGGRFYLLPDGADPGAGALLLRSGATRTLHADPAAVAPYEVSREEGRAFLDAKLDAFVGGTQARVESWLDRVMPGARQGGGAGDLADARPAASGRASDAPSVSPSPVAEPSPGAAESFAAASDSGSAGDADRAGRAGSDAADAVSADAGPSTEHGPGVKFFASLTGQAEDEVARSPEALLRGLGKLFESAAQAVADAGSGEEGREAVRARLRALGDQLRAHGIAVPPPPADAGASGAEKDGQGGGAPSANHQDKRIEDQA